MQIVTRWAKIARPTRHRPKPYYARRMTLIAVPIFVRELPEVGMILSHHLLIPFWNIGSAVAGTEVVGNFPGTIDPAERVKILRVKGAEGRFPFDLFG